MAVYDFLCLDCGERFALDSRQPIEGTRIVSPKCGTPHVRQTFDSYLRNADRARAARRLDEARCSHFG